MSRTRSRLPMEEQVRPQDEPALLLIATGFNCELITPSPYELLIDWDGGSNIPDVWFRVEGLLREVYGIARTEFWKSRSGNLHLRVVLNKSLTAFERVALQAACGSDPHRAIYECRDTRMGSTVPTVLFKPLPKQLLAPKERLILL